MVTNTGGRMILDNAPDTSYLFDISLYQGDRRGYKESRKLPNLLRSTTDPSYPKNPLKTSFGHHWNGLPLIDALRCEYNMKPYEVLACECLANLFMDEVRKANKRLSKSKIAFVKTIIQIALMNGADGTVITLESQDLIPMGLKKDAARTALRQLHDLGIIICMFGYGYYDKEGAQRSCPTGFMLWPYNSGRIAEIVTRLECCKLSIADLGNISLGEEGTIVYNN